MARQRWQYAFWRILQGLTADHAPWDRGVLEAHWMHNVPTRTLWTRLERARRRRSGPLSWVWPPRRKYLDGLIWGITREIGRREDGSGSSRSSPSPDGSP
jgi:hypothetical protein